LRGWFLQLEGLRLKADIVEKAAEEEKEIEEHLISSDIDDNVVVTLTSIIMIPTNSASNKFLW
jgi:hypothetical protein